MEIIEKYLHQFLIRNDLAYIPGIGIFEAKNLKAEKNPSTKTMNPPRRVVSFKQERSTNNDFIKFLMEIKKADEEKVKKELLEWVNKIKKEIVANKKHEIADLGILELNPAKKLSFRPIDGLNLNPESLGLKSVKAEPIERKEAKKEEAKVPVAKEPQKVEKPTVKETPKVTPKPEVKKKKNPLIKVGIILIILLSISAISLYFLNQNPQEKIVKKPDTHVQDSINQARLDSITAAQLAADTVSAPEPEPEPKPEPVVTISSKMNRFYIIVNGFKREKNAYAYRLEMVGKGMKEAKVIEPNDAKELYRVSLEDYDDKKTAINRMIELRSDFGNEIWVHIY